MSGLIPSDMAQAFAEDTAVPHYMAELFFDSATVRVTDIPYPVVWDGKEWAGYGEFIGLEPISEGGQLQAQDLTATLSGVPIALQALALAEHSTDRPYIIYLAALHRTTHTIINATPRWGGRMNTLESDEDGETATIRLRLEHELARWRTPIGGRYTDADQQRRFPGDRGLSGIADAASGTVTWPTKQWRPA